jgi:hypothetical protein
MRIKRISVYKNDKRRWVLHTFIGSHIRDLELRSVDNNAPVEAAIEAATAKLPVAVVWALSENHATARPIKTPA